MSLTFSDAVDQIMDIFKAAWDTTGFPTYYEDVRQQRDSNERPWSTTTLRHASGQQMTLGTATGTSRFARDGLLIVQIFTPAGKGLQDAYNLAKVVVDAYEGSTTPGGVWFRNVRLNEVGRDGRFFQMNVLVEFLYDELK